MHAWSVPTHRLAARCPPRHPSSPLPHGRRGAVVQHDRGSQREGRRGINRQPIYRVRRQAPAGNQAAETFARHLYRDLACDLGRYPQDEGKLQIHGQAVTMREGAMRLLSALAMMVMPLAAIADEGSIHLDHVWSRAALAGHEGVVYLTITSAGTQDSLVDITTPASANAELHQSFSDHGVVRMRPVPSLQIEPGKPV